MMDWRTMTYSRLITQDEYDRIVDEVGGVAFETGIEAGLTLTLQVLKTYQVDDKAIKVIEQSARAAIQRDKQLRAEAVIAGVNG
jgi:hypothetical protein